MTPRLTMSLNDVPTPFPIRQGKMCRSIKVETAAKEVADVFRKHDFFGQIDIAEMGLMTKAHVFRQQHTPDVIYVELLDDEYELTDDFQLPFHV